MITDYNNCAINIKEEIIKDISSIFKIYNNELKLQLGIEDLLIDSHNVIQSSTAIGFCMEEFLIRNLIKISENKKIDQKIVQNKYERIIGKSIVNTSADLLISNNKYTIFVNLKVQNKKSSNNAIAALTQLLKDYVDNETEKMKLYLIFKVFYDIQDGKIKIINNESYFLEQINFDYLRIDNRSWSKNSKGDNGRIQYSIKNGLMSLKEINYEITCSNLIKYKDKIQNKKGN